MDERERQEYLENYQRAKEHGIRFFPDALFKDAVVSLLIFLILVGLAYFVGSPLEPQADPSDTNYTPRPEWYFLFLFQMLKYFPGSLEVVGAVIIPTIIILLLLALPFLDRTRWRHFSKRPLITGLTAFLVLGISWLTVQALAEAPPPVEVAAGDQTAQLYTDNCAACHGPTVQVPQGTNLHQVIALGRHEGMPAWSGDLTSDEIDALAGFILSPAGNVLFVQNCAACHATPELVSSDPLELDRALKRGPAYAPHDGLGLPDWNELLGSGGRTALLNFLIAPDGQRLFTVNCASCHGRSVVVRGDESSMREIIARGGLHLEMPPWRERLSDSEVELLARFVVDPDGTSEVTPLFEQHCSDCHGQFIPMASDVDQARESIALGGAHETMPVWGEVLTDQQLDALVSYSLQAASGTPIEVGRQLFSQNCSPCHGDFGEGGPNPSRPNDIIAPISTAEYLKARDDITLRAIISAGQPNFGMSPFATQFGGPLDSNDIDAIVSFLRAWQDNPPVEYPPEVVARTVSIDGAEIYADVCAQCHGPDGGGSVGPSLRSEEFQASVTDDQLFDDINLGHEATSMIGWGEILNAEQIGELVAFIRQFATGEPTAAAGPPTFRADVSPILRTACAMCHGVAGGWSVASYDSVINSGDNGPAVIPGDPVNSLLAKKLLGTQERGAIMPPGSPMRSNQIQIILDWIAAGALDN